MEYTSQLLLSLCCAAWTSPCPASVSPLLLGGAPTLQPTTASLLSSLNSIVLPPFTCTVCAVLHYSSLDSSAVSPRLGHDPAGLDEPAQTALHRVSTSDWTVAGRSRLPANSSDHLRLRPYELSCLWLSSTATWPAGVPGPLPISAHRHPAASAPISLYSPSVALHNRYDCHGLAVSAGCPVLPSLPRSRQGGAVRPQRMAHCALLHLRSTYIWVATA